MSTYCSMPDLPLPDGAIYLDVAYDCFGRDTRITLQGGICYPTSAEARRIAIALLQAAEAADEHAEAMRDEEA